MVAVYKDRTASWEGNDGGLDRHGGVGAPSATLSLLRDTQKEPHRILMRRDHQKKVFGCRLMGGRVHWAAGAHDRLFGFLYPFGIRPSI